MPTENLPVDFVMTAKAFDTIMNAVLKALDKDHAKLEARIAALEARQQKE
jgi:BMFP domain-containing protein YqiC